MLTLKFYFFCLYLPSSGIIDGGVGREGKRRKKGKGGKRRERREGSGEERRGRLGRRRDGEEGNRGEGRGGEEEMEKGKGDIRRGEEREEREGGERTLETCLPVLHFGQHCTSARSSLPFSNLQGDFTKLSPKLKGNLDHSSYPETALNTERLQTNQIEYKMIQTPLFFLDFLSKTVSCSY